MHHYAFFIYFFIFIFFDKDFASFIFCFVFVTSLLLLFWLFSLLFHFLPFLLICQRRKRRKCVLQQKTFSHTYQVWSSNNSDDKTFKSQISKTEKTEFYSLVYLMSVCLICLSVTMSTLWSMKEANLKSSLMHCIAHYTTLHYTTQGEIFQMSILLCRCMIGFTWGTLANSVIK